MVTLSHPQYKVHKPKSKVLGLSLSDLYPSYYTKQKSVNDFPGDLDSSGVRVGMGHLEIPNGSTYDGSFNKVNDVTLDRDGKVKIVFNNEIVRVFQTGSE